VLLKVGELARHTGLTVRTLHHYDSIGLLCPSARSEAGYRLYSHADVARLHAVQALRHLGLGLAEIGTLLADSGESLPAINARQIRALDHDIAQATELRSRLALLQERFAQGAQPQTRDLLASLHRWRARPPAGCCAACRRHRCSAAWAWRCWPPCCSRSSPRRCPGCETPRRYLPRNGGAAGAAISSPA
jgi:DNA-binding transcriptional MerR regulator